MTRWNPRKRKFAPWVGAKLVEEGELFRGFNSAKAARRFADCDDCVWDGRLVKAEGRRIRVREEILAPR